MNYQEADAAYSYNSELGELRWKQRRAQRVQVGDIAGGYYTNGYRCVAYENKNYLVHRVIWLLVHGEWPPNQIDHINGVRDDNRLCNLRTATSIENARNSKKRKTNTSGATGVMWNKQKQKWHAVIGSDGNRKHLGFFKEWWDAVCSRKAEEHRRGYHPNSGR